jgi:PAS domain S-box-containing protein
MRAGARVVGHVSRYLAAIFAVAAAYALREALTLATGPGLPPFITFYPSIMLVAFLAGLGPGMLASVLASATAVFWIYPFHGALERMTPVEGVGIALFFTFGAIMGVISELNSRTRKRAELAQKELSLRESEARFSTVFHSSPMAMTISDLGDERLMDVNQTYLNMSGFTRDETVGRSIADLGYEVISPVPHAVLGELGNSASWEAQYRKRTGAVLTALVSAEVIQVAGHRCLWSVIQDITERARDEKALRESEERFRGTLESMLVGCQIIGFDWTYLYINEMAARHGGTRPEQLVGRKMQEAYPGIDATQMFASLVRSMEERIPLRIENEFRLPDGASTWFDLSFQPVPEGVFILSYDISERKRSEEALRLSEEKFSHAFANAPAAIALTRVEDGLFLEVNDRWVELMGYGRAETIGQSARAMSIWPSEADSKRFVQVLGTEGSLRGWEQEFRKKSGEPFVAQLSASVMTVRGERAVMSILVDITDRKRAERALQDNQRLLQTLMDLVPPFIFAKDRNSRHIFVNRSCAEANGLTPDRMIGLTDLDLVADRDQAEGFMRHDREVIDQGVAKINVEERLTDAAGRTRVLQTTKIPFMLPGSSQPALLGVAVDVTEQKRAEEEIRLLNTQLERRVEERTAELAEANKELESFAYAVSHDLRAPLRALSGFSQALQEDFAAQLKGEALTYLDQIRLATVRMAELIDGILTLSRATRGDLRREDVDLSSLASRILGDLAKAEPDRRVSWTVEPGLMGLGDARLVENVLDNLLGNAWKYTSRKDAPVIRFYAERAEGETAFCVADNGAGFDMKHHARLFRPFQRLHRQEEFPGTGIGLATVQRIIQRHGGRLQAAGAPGEGAVFSFSLPPRLALAAATKEQP